MGSARGGTEGLGHRFALCGGLGEGGGDVCLSVSVCLSVTKVGD